MIKRALGAFADGNGSDDDSSDEGFTQAEKQKLYRRLVPGAGAGRGRAKGGSKGAQGRGRQQDSDESEEEEDSDQGAEGLRREQESDDEPAVPAEAAKDIKFRGKFRCELCPDKVLMNEKMMEAHLKSAGHKRNEKRFEHAKEIGVEAYVQECTERLKAKEKAKAGLSNNTFKHKTYWKEQRRKAREKEKERKGKAAKKKSKEFSEDQVAQMKARFQAKKARRMARKAAAATKAAKAEAAGVSAKKTKKSRKAEVEVIPQKASSTAPRPVTKKRKKVRE